MLCSSIMLLLYPCDLTDAEWAQLSPLLPSPRGAAGRAAGRCGCSSMRSSTFCARLCLALSPAGVPALATGLYDIPPVAPTRGLAAGHEAFTPRGPRAGRA